MTNQEWKQRSAQRILNAVRKAGTIKIRDLQRATHYNRGPAEESVSLWWAALDYLERNKFVVVKRERLFTIEGDDELGLKERLVMTPQAAALSPMAGSNASMGVV
jgi:hypothetical protein